MKDFAAGSRSGPDPKFIRCFRIATSCCCGCVSLKHGTVFICVFDLTLGLASAGIVFMVIEEKLEPSSFLAIVVVNIIAMILAIPSLVSVLKPILPGVKLRSITCYMLWKTLEIILCPFLDIYALWQSTEYSPGGNVVVREKVTHGDVEKELYNEEVYEEDSLPIINHISFQAIVITVLVIWLPIRIFIVYILFSYQKRLERGEILYIEYSRRQLQRQMEKMYDEQIERKQIWEENLPTEKEHTSHCSSPYRFNYRKPEHNIIKDRCGDVDDM